VGRLGGHAVVLELLVLLARADDATGDHDALRADNHHCCRRWDGRDKRSACGER